MLRKTLEIYTDGGCRPSNPGPGIAGFIVVDKQEILHEFTHIVKWSTNNCMEMLSTIAALKWIKANVPDHLIYLHTDSQYVQKGVNEWLWKWKRNGFISATRKPVANKEMWLQIDALNTKNITIQWVRGHNGNQFNEYIDNLCTETLKTYLENEKSTSSPEQIDPAVIAAPYTDLIEVAPF